MSKPQHEIELTAIAFVQAARRENTDEMLAALKNGMEDSKDVINLLHYMAGMIVASNELVARLLGTNVDKLFAQMEAQIIRENN
jgi:hypothetical protein